jgi:hypothetical protein
VAATDSDDQRASFSTYGSWVDIAAPGVDILSLRASGTSLGTTYDNYTTIASGTSMACPYVAGACALLFSIFPEIDIDELEHALKESTDPIAQGVCASGRLNVARTAMQIFSPEGRILLDKDFYPSSALIGITLLDIDLKGNATHQVTIDSDGGDFETVLLSETSTLGIFSGTISIGLDAPNIEDGILQLSHGQIVTATYQDADDGTGSPAVVTDTATADFEGPIISNVRIGLPGRQPKIYFDTDEPTTARVLYDLACGGPYSFEGLDPSLKTNHAIKIGEMSPLTDYYFIVEATDVAGNETIDTNGGICYTFTTIAASDEINVPAQCPTIQEAIDNCWDGTTVLVADGIYTGEGNRDIDFKGSAITVQSENGPENCIIDCQGTAGNPHRGFYFHSGEGSDSVLDGFTIKNGYAINNWGAGGGIRCYKSSPTIKNCIITGNTAKSPYQYTVSDAGGMYNLDSDPTLINCTFSNNYASGYGGGMVNEGGSSPTLINCVFKENRVYNHGGAMWNLIYSSPTMINCTIIDNRARGRCGGIYNQHECNPTLTNCLIARNVSGWDGGAMLNRAGANPILNNCTIVDNSTAYDGKDGIYNWVKAGYPCSPMLTNCIVWPDNISGGTPIINYSCIPSGGWSGTGNIHSNPLFVNAGNSNYRLRKEDSPCIDTGTNYPPGGLLETDIEGKPRLIDGNGDTVATVDMGAYEYTPGPIQIAINAASDGDTVVINPGIYYENIDFLGKNITLTSTNPAVVAATVISGGSQNPVITFSNAEDSNSVITGFTITGGQSGIYCDGTSPTITDCNIIGNASMGIYCYDAFPTIVDSVIDANGGHALELWYASEPTIINCIIIGEIISGTVENQTTGKKYILIQNAINTALNGDEIVAGEAAYNENINFTGKNIKFRSADPNDSAIVAATIINAENNNYPVVTFATGEIADSVLAGFTITGGSEGIYCDNTTPIITKCIISGNYDSGVLAQGSLAPTITDCTITQNIGAGLCVDDAIITDCTITENQGAGIKTQNEFTSIITDCIITSNEEAGIDSSGAGAVISDCIISDNLDSGIKAQGQLNSFFTITKCKINGNSAFGQHTGGGGIACFAGGTYFIDNCIITGNQALNGGGISCFGTLTINNCTIADNTATRFGGAIAFWNNNALSLSNCILWDNQASTGPQIYFRFPDTTLVTYCDVEGGFAGQGNMDTDPCFVEPADGDYHLLWSSPCINAGDPSFTAEPGETDLDGRPRVIADIVDMGVYETMTTLPPIELSMKFTPQTLNLCSKGKWVKAHFVLPVDFTIEDVNVSDSATLEPFDVQSDNINVFMNEDGLVEIEIAFDRSAFPFRDNRISDGAIELTVTGMLANGQCFYGTDTITIIINKHQ